MMTLGGHMRELARTGIFMTPLLVVMLLVWNVQDQSPVLGMWGFTVILFYVLSEVAFSRRMRR